MTISRQVFLVAVMLSIGHAAWASDQSNFVARVKKSGITNDIDTGRRVCLCSGRTLNGRVGMFIVFQSGFSFGRACAIPTFDLDGNLTGESNCESFGGTFEVLSR